MSVEALNHFYKDTRLVLDAFRTPLGTLIAVPGNLEEIYTYRQKILEHYHSLPIKDKAILFAELGLNVGNVSLSIFNTYHQAENFVRVVQTGADISEGVIQAATALCPFLAIGGVLSTAASLTKEIRDKRAKSLEIHEFEVLLADLTKDIRPLYKDYYAYLGECTQDDVEALSVVKRLQSFIDKDTDTSQIFIALEKKSLADLIQEQAYANYYGSEKPMPLTNYYQLVIQQKVQNVVLASQHERIMLRQLVISEQHMQNLRVGTPMLQKASDKRWLLLLMTSTCFVLACGILLASVGVFPPTAGLALLACSAAVGLLMPAAKKSIENKEGMISQQLDPDKTSIENYLYQDKDEPLAERRPNDDQYDTISEKLQGFISTSQDRLSKPLRALIAEERFQQASSFDQLYSIRKLVQTNRTLVKAKWEYFALQHHDLYLLIDKLPLDNAKKTKMALEAYEHRQVKLANQRAHANQEAKRTSVYADAKLRTDIRYDSIEPEQSRSISSFFSMPAS